MTLDQDVSMTDRCVRIEAHHVDGADPSLAYVALYSTDERGQWALQADWSFDALGGGDDEAKMLQAILLIVRKLLA